MRVATRSVNILTPRERQILEALVQGNTTREIADRCGIGRQTVKNYVTVIYKKLDVCRRTELQGLADVQLAAEGWTASKAPSPASVSRTARAAVDDGGATRPRQCL